MKYKSITIFIAPIPKVDQITAFKKKNLFLKLLNLQIESCCSANLLSPLRSTDKIALGYWYDVFFSENILRRVRELPEDRVNGEEHLSKNSTELSS